MKSIANILLYVFAALAVLSGAYVVFTPGAMSSETAWSPDKMPVTVIIWVALLAFILSVILFVVYKMVDIVKHPAHTKEFLYVAGAVLVSLIIGFVFSGNESIVYGNGSVYPEGMSSKLIGTGLIATLVLLIGSVAYMVFDTVKGLFKS